MKYELDTIKVTAQIEENSTEKVERLSDVTLRYSELREKQKEHIYALFLDNGNHVIGDKLIGLGSTHKATFDIKDIARTAALVKAGATILVHNHPSGKAEATQQDIKSTNAVQTALSTIGTELLDHVIITRNGSHSMRANNEGPF